MEDRTFLLSTLLDGLDGVYYLEGQYLTKVDLPLISTFQQVRINKLLRLSNGDLAIGTILDGLFLLDNQFNLKYHINQSNGLSNNTVFSLFEDKDGDLWLGQKLIHKSIPT